jgi:hypothetical protein
MQFHVSPQSAGLIAGILALVALEKPGRRSKVIAILLFAYIIISHPTTAFMVLSAAGLVWLIRVLVIRDKRMLLQPLPLLVIGWIAWVMFYATPFRQGVAELATTVPLTGITFLDASMAEARSRLHGILYWAPRMRFIVLGIFGIGSVFYLVRQWLSKDNYGQKLLITYTAFLIAPVTMTLVDITFIREGQLHDRYFLFFVLVASILLVRLAEGIRHPVIKNSYLLGLVFVALFNFTTAYYQSSLLVTSDETISASEFVNSNTSSQVVGGRILPDLADPYQSSVLRDTALHQLYPQALTSLEPPSIVVLDDHDRAWYENWYGIDKYNLYAQEVEPEAEFEKVYHNGKYDIYWFEGAE